MNTETTGHAVQITHNPNNLTASKFEEEKSKQMAALQGAIAALVPGLQHVAGKSDGYGSNPLNDLMGHISRMNNELINLSCKQFRGDMVFGDAPFIPQQ